VDIDPAALEAARQNALDNKVRIRCGLPDIAADAYDLVVANILASPLQVLAPLLCGHVTPGGSLLLSGILERQTSTLITAYQAHTRLRVVDVQEGWALMLGGA
jgi:ribosomal protein L11 methyltransferase